MLRIIKEPTPAIQLKNIQTWQKHVTVEIQLSWQVILGLADLFTQIPAIAKEYRYLQSMEYAELNQREYQQRRKERFLNGLRILSSYRHSGKNIFHRRDDSRVVDALHIYPLVRRRYLRRRNYAIATAVANGVSLAALSERYKLSKGRISQIVKQHKEFT